MLIWEVSHQGHSDFACKQHSQNGFGVSQEPSTAPNLDKVGDITNEWSSPSFSKNDLKKWPSRIEVKGLHAIHNHLR